MTTIKTDRDNFARRYLEKQRKARSEELKKSNAGRKPIPESEKREKNKVSVYLNQEEMELVRNFVGDRSISDVIRTLVLNEAKKAE